MCAKSVRMATGDPPRQTSFLTPWSVLLRTFGCKSAVKRACKAARPSCGRRRVRTTRRARPPLKVGWPCVCGDAPRLKTFHVASRCTLLRKRPPPVQIPVTYAGFFFFCSIDGQAQAGSPGSHASRFGSCSREALPAVLAPSGPSRESSRATAGPPLCPFAFRAPGSSLPAVSWK